MKLQKSTLAGAIVLILFLIVPIQGRRTHYNKTLKHNHIDRALNKEVQLQRAEHIYQNLEKHAPQEDCQKFALHKCGQTFLRAQKLLSYLKTNLVGIRTRCGVRTAFFECLKTTREKLCSRPFKEFNKEDKEFRKRLTTTLWSMRVCVLGMKSAKHV
ncbi:uncharacterized protein CDAR_55701 [Caerostris darwini]|uniref:Uncharacterized protein n=1 Tax=Caerostris darwini TaxID=1538125 RepID=A0AAV4W288_9ARAC|nr:uncharacterized protein CDAR_55701 [Caerostris darwini]